MMIASNQPAEVLLDNQWMEVHIELPHAQIAILDKVAQIRWQVSVPERCGEVAFLLEGRQRELVYGLGCEGKRGVLFDNNYYMVRSSEWEDYHDVSLIGGLGDDESTRVNLRLLLSETEPLLHFFCYVDGTRDEWVRRIQFPEGLVTPGGAHNRVWLPPDVKQIKDLSEEELGAKMWQPPLDQDHSIAGAPFFLATQREEERASTCLGYLHHPLTLLHIQRQGEAGQVVTPLTNRPAETGMSEDHPFQFSLQLFPNDDLTAALWLAREFLFQEQTSIGL